MGAGLSGQHVYGCWVCRSSGSSSLRNCRQTTTTDHWHSYCWPTWFLLRRPCYMELTDTTHDWPVLFSETVEDISVLFTLHSNLQFSVAAPLRRICDVSSVNLRLQFPFNNNNNNNNNNRWERIHLATSSMHADIRVSRSWDADGRQEPDICVTSA